MRKATTSSHEQTAGRGFQHHKRARRKGRSFFPPGGNDRIYTPDALARDIVKYIQPDGKILEPAAGGGAFLRALPPSCHWCEIDKGVDFFKCRRHYDWIITNPPYSVFTEFLKKSLQTATNIVFLCPVPAWFQRARERAIRDAGYGILEICYIPTPPAPWPPFGFSLGAVWLRRGWQGSITFSRLPSKLWRADGSGKMVDYGEREDSL
jgi:hypothetical protein